MTDLALSTRTRDLVVQIRPDGKATLLPVQGAEEVAQRVGIFLRTWIGEWFLDSLWGVPYLTDILGHSRRRAAIEAILRAKILSVEGVSAITAFALEIDRAQRTMAVRFEISTPQGLSAGGQVTI